MWGIAALLLLMVLYGVVIFNRLISDRNQVRAAWSDIDVQLLRRHDLTKPLLEITQAYAQYERTTLTRIAELRSQAARTFALKERAEVEQDLNTQIQQLLLLQESYPELKASEQFLKLQRELVDIEDHLQYARRFYNGSVKQFNTRLQHFPELIVAKLFFFRPAEFFSSDSSSPL